MDGDYEILENLQAKHLAEMTYSKSSTCLSYTFYSFLTVTGTLILQP